MTDTNKLKLSRRNTKGKLTRTLLMIHSLLDNDTDDLETLKGYVTRAEEQFHRVEERHAELIDSIEAESQFDEEEKWMTECEKEFVQVLIQARRLINRLSLHSSSNTDSTSTPSTHTASPGPSEPVSPGTSVPMSSQAPPTPSRALRQSTSAPSPKMAPMKFPTFSGGFEGLQSVQAAISPLCRRFD